MKRVCLLIYSTSLVLSFFSCERKEKDQNQKKEQFEILHIDILSYTNPLNPGSDTMVKADFYLVKGFEDTREIRTKIEDFVQQNKGNNPDSFFQYDMGFYKQSGETTIPNIEKNRRLIDRYSQQHDLIYSFSWSKGKLVNKMKFKDGEVID